MKYIIKSFLTRIPYAYPVARYLHHKYYYFRLRRISAKDVFSHIYRSKAWGDGDSVSGGGSNLEETKTIREKLPVLLRNYSVSSILDIACGDFYWMDKVKLEKIEYIGADIVPELVENNNKYENNASYMPTCLRNSV